MGRSRRQAPRTALAAPPALGLVALAAAIACALSGCALPGRVGAPDAAEADVADAARAELASPEDGATAGDSADAPADAQPPTGDGPPPDPPRDRGIDFSQPDGGSCTFQDPSGTLAVGANDGDLGGPLAVADTWLDESAPDTPRLTDTELVARNNPGERGVILLRFELAGLPLRTVLSAQLQVFVTDHDPDVQVHVVRQPWVPAEATWNEASRTVRWTAAGCYEGEVGACRIDPALDVVDLETGWRTVELPPKLVQGWLEAPDTNLGLLLLIPTTGESSDDEFAMVASEGVDCQRPRLLLTGTR